MISDDQIKALAVARGFKLTNETGDDLKPYVYAFARDIAKLEIQAFCERCTLTDDNILAVRDMAINGDEPIHEKIIWFARMIATLAQEVRPLEFEPCQLQSPVLPLAYLNAKSPLGRYLIHKYKDGGKTVYFYTGPNRVSSDNGTEAEAIAAAQTDFAARVLANLKYGGKDD